jgi:hypothetical protein
MFFFTDSIELLLFGGKGEKPTELSSNEQWRLILDGEVDLKFSIGFGYYYLMILFIYFYVGVII